MCTVYAAHALGIITRSLVRTITYHKENCVCIKKTQNKVEVDEHRVDTTNAPDGVRPRLFRLPLLKYELKSQLDLHVHNSNTIKNNSNLCNYNTYSQFCHQVIHKSFPSDEIEYEKLL